MPASGESLLVRAGLVRPEQLAEAQRLRARGGGTVGEWLVRLGAVSEPQLVDFYHRRLLVPRITAAQLARVPADILSAVPADLAIEFRVLPVAIDADKVLTLAMGDPSDTHAAEEVAFYSDRACHRAVAACSDILAAIDRQYRARPPAPPRFPDEHDLPPSLGQVLDRVLEEELSESRDEEVLLLTRVKPGSVPPPPPAPTVPAAPIPEVVPTETSSRARWITQTHSRVTTPSGRAPSEPPATEAEPPIPLTRAVTTPPAEGAPRRRSRTLPGVRAMPELPVDALRATRTREEIATTILGYATHLSPATALFVIRKGSLSGFDGSGELEPEAVRGTHVSLEEPTLVRDVVGSRVPYRGPLVDAPALRPLAKLLGQRNGDTVLVPISVGDKVVAVLIAAGVVTQLSDVALRDLAHETGLAYERLIHATRR